MQKIYSRINWENFPSEKTAVNESNLNKMDLAIDNLDDRVVAMDASKVDLTKANELVKEILWDESNGTLTVVKMNGSRAVIDTKLEKLAVNFTYNPQTQQLVITLDDGTVQNVDLSSLITEYEFLDSDTIAFEIAGGKVKANVKNGSITEDHLSPDYLGEIRTQVGKAEMSAKSADASEKNAVSSSALSKSYAVGGTGTRDGEDTDNARYYMEQAKAVSAVDIATTEKAGIVKPDGTTITADEDGTLHGVAKVTVDTALSPTSTNPVQNKVVKAYVDKKVSENVDFSTSTSKTLNDTVEAPLMLGKATRNLLNPTLQTSTQNGITCTNNGDGTYTLNGTATSEVIFVFLPDEQGKTFYKNIVGKTLKFLNGGSVNPPVGRFIFTLRDGNKWWVKGEKWNNDIFTVSEGYSQVVVDLHIYKGQTVTDLTVKPMLTTDLEATIDDFVPYSGYNIKTIGKNLLNSTFDTITDNGVTFTRNDDGTFSLSGSRTDTSILSFTRIDMPIKKGRYKLTGALDENNFIRCIIRKPDVPSRIINDYGNGVVLDVNETDTIITLMIVSTDDTSQTRIIKPMLTTDLEATYDDFVPYTESTVHIDSLTEFPLLGLKSFDGETNIISPGNVEVTYAKSESGKVILDMSENKLDKDNVVNNQTTTVEGFALDARQANPNINGSLAKQISDLNGSLKNENIIPINIDGIPYNNLNFYVIRGGYCYLSLYIQDINNTDQIFIYGVPDPILSLNFPAIHFHYGAGDNKIALGSVFKSGVDGMNKPYVRITPKEVNGLCASVVYPIAFN